MKKRPVFYCEHCGERVRQNDRVCSHCGRFFSSVKCPSCGFSGDSRAFRDGCPACGYAFAGSRTLDGSKRDERAEREEPDPLPWWMYAVSLALLALIAAIILLRK